jgi:integrase
MLQALNRWVRNHNSGRYQTQARSVVETFHQWLILHRDTQRFDGLDADDLRAYAYHLGDRVEDDEIAESTAETYYNIVRSFLEWAVADDLLDTNPAAKNKATSVVPEPTDTTEDDDRSFWHKREREVILRFVDERVDAALDDGDELERIVAMRNRALVYLLAWTGCRGAELLREPADDRRGGLEWRHIDPDLGVVEVLGKSGETEYGQLLDPVLDRLERYERVLDPPSEDWPVFPTTHRATLYDALDAESGEEHPLLTARRVGVEVPNISVQAGRRVMQRLSEDSPLEFDDGDYLKLHGARRGLGHEVYEQDAELAQDVLRHKDIGVTHDSYRDVAASKRREDLGDVLFGDSE